MPFSPLVYNGKQLRLHKCVVSPEFDAPTIIVENQWDYVEMWLKRQNMADALFFWKQAEAFYNASKVLPNTSSPLTSYYAAMNATKAFLLVKGVATTPYHGVSGERLAGKTSLTREVIRITRGGVFTALCGYLNEPTVRGTQFTLKSVLYNLPYVHRAYTLTYTSEQELFIPIEKPLFVRIDGTSQAYLCFEIVDPRYHHHQLISSLDHCERDIGVQDKYLVRRTNRFTWRDADPVAANLVRFRNYYRRMRRTTFYIKGFRRLWYVKRAGATAGPLNRSSLTLAYMALHRLSEIARYSPDSLARHFDSQHNWLLSEFIHLALDQFLDELAAEMTGQEFMLGGVR